MPLTPREIKRSLEDRETNASRWARENGFTAWQVRAVIHRNPEVVYPEIRKALAAFLGVPVSEVGREPRRPALVEVEPQEAAA